MLVQENFDASFEKSSMPMPMPMPMPMLELFPNMIPVPGDVLAVLGVTCAALVILWLASVLVK